MSIELLGAIILINNQFNRLRYIHMKNNLYYGNMNLESNINNFNNINGLVRSHFNINMSKDVQLKLNTIAKPL